MEPAGLGCEYTLLPGPCALAGDLLEHRLQLGPQDSGNSSLDVLSCNAATIIQGIRLVRTVPTQNANI